MRIPTIVLLLAATAGLGACSSTGFLDGAARVRAESSDPCLDRPPVAMMPGCQVPIYECYDEPIYCTRREKLYGEETVPVYRVRKKPVTWPVTDYCTGCQTEKTLWSVNQKVQVGVKRVKTCIGYKETKELVGHCRKRRIVGWRTVEPAPTPCAPDPCSPAR